MSVIWITGTSCSGKSTMVKNIIKSYKYFGSKNKIDKIKYIKFKNLLVIGGTYLVQDKHNCGLDEYYRCSSKYLKNNYIKLINLEYTKNKNILCETSTRRFFNKDLLYWLVTNIDLKIFYLKTMKSVLDERAKIRDNSYDKKRTDRRTIYDIKHIETLLSDKNIKKCVTYLTNNNVKDGIKNQDIISKCLGII